MLVAQSNQKPEKDMRLSIAMRRQSSMYSISLSCFPTENCENASICDTQLPLARVILTQERIRARQIYHTAAGKMFVFSKLLRFTRRESSIKCNINGS